MKHPTARYHDDMKDYYAGEAKTLKDKRAWRKTPEYAHVPANKMGDNGYMILRSVTDQNKHHVMKNYDKLPHDPSGKVLFNRSQEGHKDKIYNHMRNDSMSNYNDDD